VSLLSVRGVMHPQAYCARRIAPPPSALSGPLRELNRTNGNLINSGRITNFISPSLILL
jgi:hypothetical protein